MTDIQSQIYITGTFAALFMLNTCNIFLYRQIISVDLMKAKKRNGIDDFDHGYFWNDIYKLHLINFMIQILKKENRYLRNI